LGGHTHELLDGVNKGENLFYSKNNEPVIITQGGKDGEYAGVLNLEFDQNGVITKAQNNVTDTAKFKRSRLLMKAFDMILGKPEHLGVIKYVEPSPVHRLIDPNPHTNFIMDAMRSELGTDLALINAGNVRGYFEEGPLDSRQVFEVVPLKNDVVVLKLTEKEIVDSLKNGAKSFINPGFKPSVVIPSGLKYTVSRQGEIKSAAFIDKQGKEIPIDINNPDPNKVYTVATDDFFASGGDNLIPDKLSTNQYDKRYNFDKDKLACDYIKKLPQPIEIRDDGRMTVVD
jgi:2',3'-cyclic-nucleotide 2'-phosphodiesterase (5'-nucleotidase family)